MRIFKPSEQLGLYGLAITFILMVLVFIYVDVSTFKGVVEGAGVWAPIVFILMKISTIVFAPLSGSPLYLIVGVLFGFLPGLIYVAIGDFLGYTITFFISRFFGYSLVDKFITRNEHSLLSRIIRHLGTTKGMIQVSLTCFSVPELISYGAGLSKIKYIKFISILLPVMVSGSAVVVFFGSKIDDLNSFLTVNIIGIPIIVTLMAIGGYIFSREVKKLENNKS